MEIINHSNHLCLFIAKPSCGDYEMKMIFMWEKNNSINTIKILFGNNFLPEIETTVHDTNDFSVFVDEFNWESWMINGVIDDRLKKLVVNKLKL